MKYIALDYGTKRIGVALSDDAGKVAFPHGTLNNDVRLVENLKKIVTDNSAQCVVIGESKNYKMQDNEIMGDILDLKEILEKTVGIDAVLHPEVLTSAEAERAQRDKRGERNTRKKIDLDAAAATIILQSYLDSIK